LTKGRQDPVTTEIIRNAFLAAAEEMRAVLTRSAFSPVIYEMKDCSVGLFNEKGELLGQAPGLPFFLGALSEIVQTLIDIIGLNSFAAGDAYILNDPYLTGSHLNDVDILSPVVYGENVVGFAVTRAHWEDLGGKTATYAVDSTEIYQEGLRLGPTKLADRGELRSDVVDILRRNSRMGIQMVGDMHAQIAACRKGERSFLTLIERFGLDTIRAAMRDVFAATERLERAAIAAIPDGVYEAQGYQDNDFQTDEPILVKVKVTVSGEEMVVDTTGSSSQRRGCTNCGRPQAIAAARLAYKFLIHPEAEVTGGSFRTFDVLVEPGSVFAAEEPAACLQYGTHTMLLVDLIIKALAPAIPRQVAAGLPGDAWNVIMVHWDPNGRLASAWGEAIAGGWGANAFGDGESAVIHTGAGDFRNFPIEVMENKYPIQIHHYGLGTDSGGPGKHRGGLNVVKEYETLDERMDLSLWFERTRTPSWGLFGGEDGSVPEVIISAGTADERSLLKVDSLPLPKGTRFRVATGGGGGYGFPWERDYQHVREDVNDGYVSRAMARECYGVVLREGSLAVDEEGTYKLRKQRSGAVAGNEGAPLQSREARW
jgi:N-methylhydantoinase B